MYRGSSYIWARTKWVWNRLLMVNFSHKYLWTFQIISPRDKMGPLNSCCKDATTLKFLVLWLHEWMNCYVVSFTYNLGTQKTIPSFKGSIFDATHFELLMKLLYVELVYYDAVCLLKGRSLPNLANDEAGTRPAQLMIKPSVWTFCISSLAICSSSSCHSPYHLLHCSFVFDSLLDIIYF